MKKIAAVAAIIVAMAALPVRADEPKVAPVYGLAMEIRDQGQTVGNIAITAQQDVLAAVETGGSAGYRIEALVHPVAGSELVTIKVWLMRGGRLQQVAAPSLTLVPGHSASINTTSDTDVGLSISISPV